MPLFTFCNETLDSNIDFPELPEAYLGKSFFFRLKPPTELALDLVWLRHWHTNNIVVTSYGRRGYDHWLQFPNMADFKISPDAREIYCYPLPDIPQNTIRHLLLDQVLPRCMAFHGNLMLHASAVMLPEGLLLFTGKSRAGKSTIAGSFQQIGKAVVSDDCVRIVEHERIRAVPSYSGLRLFEDSVNALSASDQAIGSVTHYSSKKRLPSADRGMGILDNLPILAIIVLSTPVQHISRQDASISQLSLRDGFIEVFKQLFHLDTLDQEGLKLKMQTLSRMMPKLSIYRLTLPHDYMLLPVARQLILETISANS